MDENLDLAVLEVSEEIEHALSPAMKRILAALRRLREEGEDAR